MKCEVEFFVRISYFEKLNSVSVTFFIVSVMEMYVRNYGYIEVYEAEVRKKKGQILQAPLVNWVMKETTIDQNLSVFLSLHKLFFVV